MAGPSTYTPFVRRFTDERARDLSDTIDLYNRVTAQFRASDWADDNKIVEVSDYIAQTVIESVEMPHSHELAAALDTVQREILALEETIFTTPDIDWSSAMLTLQEQVDLRRHLRAQEYFLAHADKIAGELAKVLMALSAYVVDCLPKGIDDADATFTVPLYAMVSDLNTLVAMLVGTFVQDDLAELGLFSTLADRLYCNMCAASGQNPYQEHRKPLVWPVDSTLPPEDLVETYLKGTPLFDLLKTPLPFSLPEESRFEHMHIIAGTGHGKTQTLQHLIMHDLLRDPDTVPGLVIIDSQGDLIAKLARLALFDPVDGALRDRLVIIDPTDVEHPPALGLFDVDLDRVGSYDARNREQIMNGVIELYDFIFGGLLGAELTQKQNVIFRYLARLMLVIPDATILTLRDVMQDASPFVPYFDKLDGMAREFFRHEFNDRQFVETKKQILRRLWGVLENPTFERLFSNPRNRLDMFDALNSGKIILVNTAKDFLKAERSSILGRFFIALTFQAALERAAIPEQQRRPAFLYIDEAADYFDDTIDSLLSQARKFRLGVVFAHQYLDQLPRPLLASIMTNTAIKFAGGVSSSDATALARNMSTNPNTLTATRKRGKETEFAAYIRNATESAITLTVPFGTMERVPTMGQDRFDLLIARNRDAIATGPAKPRQSRPGATNGDKDRQRNVGRSDPAAAKPGKVHPQPTDEASDDDWRS